MNDRRKSLHVLPVLVCLLVLAASAPSATAQEEDSGGPGYVFGFWGGLDLAATETNDFGLDLAGGAAVQGATDLNGDANLSLDEVDRAGGSTVGLNDIDSDLSLRVQVGFTWARADDTDPYRNRLALRAWVYDPAAEDFNVDSFQDVMVGPPNDTIRVGGLVPLQGTARQVRGNGENLPWRMVGSGDLESNIWDLLWTRRVSELPAGWEVEWSAGLRYMTFDVEAQATYVTDTAEAILPSSATGDSFTEERVRFRSETTGMGPVVGARLGYRFGEAERFGLHGALEVSGLRTDADWSLQATRITRDAFVDVEPQTQADLEDSSSRTITTLEIDLGASWRFNDNVELKGGYRFSRLEDVWTRATLLDPENPTVETLRSTPEAAELTGLYVGVGISF